ncbi:hypothetical protein NQ318_011946 [Aromia moschata]|uniref:Uncharacterized protein n=1 Tax=Aromia moschata TaxID=1265417 RepID=A0AAV8XPH8_9CUCU|nr:hypothetical protein NQ318_011946 [Aromia moschata]
MALIADWNFAKSSQIDAKIIHLVQELNDDDPHRRLEFCEIMANRCQDNPFSTCVLSGTVNKQNCRYGSTENPL